MKKQSSQLVFFNELELNVYIITNVNLHIKKRRFYILKNVVFPYILQRAPLYLFQHELREMIRVCETKHIISYSFWNST